MDHSAYVDRSIHEMLQGKAVGNVSERSDEGLHVRPDTCESVVFRAVASENLTSRTHSGNSAMRMQIIFTLKI